MSTPVKWTAASRKKLHGFRAPHKSDPADVAPALADAWAALQACARLELRGDPKLVAHGEKILGERAPPTALEPAHELNRARIATIPMTAEGCAKWEGWALSRAVIAVWCEVGSPRAAVDLLLGPPRLGGMGKHLLRHEPRVEKTCQGCGASWEGSQDECCGPVVAAETGEPSPWGALWHVYQPLWWALRARLSAADEAAFAAARASVEELFTDDLEPERHAWLTFAFNRDLDLARREIDRARRRLDAASWSLFPLPLLVSAPDGDLALELINRHELHSFGHLGFDLVEALGPAARPVLEAGLERIFKRSRKQYHKPGIAALKLVE